jgi:hypothetical protein
VTVVAERQERDSLAVERQVRTVNEYVVYETKSQGKKSRDFVHHRRQKKYSRLTPEISSFPTETQTNKILRFKKHMTGPKDLLKKCNGVNYVLCSTLSQSRRERERERERAITDVRIYIPHDACTYMQTGQHVLCQITP